MIRATLIAALLAAPAGATTPEETAWIGMVERCLSEVTSNQRLPMMGAGWRRNSFHDSDDTSYRVRSYEHRDTGLIAVFQQDMPDRTLQSCGTSIWRHLPGAAVAHATEAWISRETAAGRLTLTGTRDGAGGKGPVPDGTRIYLWCGPKGAAQIEFDLSDFPPAAMDVYRADSCKAGG
jgi:hypothetical protein